MNSRNRIFILLAVICAASLAYYFLSTPSSKDLVLIGTWIRIRSSSARRCKAASQNCSSMKEHK